MADIVENGTNSNYSFSGEVDQLWIEKWNNKVHEEYIKGENLLGYFDVNTVVGTNKISNKYLGDTTVQAARPGQSVTPTETFVDKNAVVVDTVLMARNATMQLDDVQNDIDGLKSKLARNQMKQLMKFEDTMVIQQLLDGVIKNTETARSSVPRVPGHGFSIKRLMSTTQLQDPNSVLAGLEMNFEDMMNQEVDMEDFTVLLKPIAFFCLMDSQQIVNKDYTTSTGATVSGYMLKRWGVRVVNSLRYPQTANSASDRHLLSNAGNGYRYDVSAEMLTAFAVVFAREALLVGRSISPTGEMWRDKDTKAYLIDSFMAEGAVPDRWEAVSSLFTNGSTENTDVTARAARKAVINKTLS